ncbi:MAG: hypothetical protein ACR2NN_17040 [Bryobacteraceae bacterium]
MSDRQFLAVLLPTLLPTITVLVGILFNNYRMTDLRRHLDSRIDDLRRLMDANTKGIMDKLDSIDRRVTDLVYPR